MRWALALLLAIPLSASDGPRIVYNKVFPGSLPPFVEIVLEQDGSATYKEAPDDDKPVVFKLRNADVESIFELVEKLDYFSKPLEAGLKVANTGEKTFRYISGDNNNEVKFNFTRDLNARFLSDWFNRITETQRHFLNLERSVHFDKLGANKVLLQIQISADKNRLVAGDHFLPLLDRIVSGDSYINMARERAAKLADFIRAADGNSN